MLEQLSAHSSATCSTLVLDDSCIRGYFCRKSFLILQVGAEFFFFFLTGWISSVGKKIKDRRNGCGGAFDMEPSRHILFF